jgi:hypothetical protein
MSKVIEFLSSIELTDELEEQIINGISKIVLDAKQNKEADLMLSQYAFGESIGNGVKQLIKNQQKYNLMDSQNPNIMHRYDFMLSLVPEIYKQMPVLNLIGLQPLPEPVGYAYYMVFDLSMGRMEIKHHTVEATTRKLKTSFQIEAMQDNSLIDMGDVKSKYASLLAKELSAMILHELLDNNVTNAHNIEECRDLIKSIDNDRTKKINVVLLSPNTLQSFGNLDEFENIQFIPDVCVSDDFIYLGYKNANETNVGFIFSPYQTLLAAGVILNSSTLEPVLGLLTRYGTFKTEQFADFYDVIQLVK